MAAQQIPCGRSGLRQGCQRAGERAARPFFTGSAADLKFVNRARQVRPAHSRSKSSTQIISLLVPMSFRGSWNVIAEIDHELRNVGTSGAARRLDLRRNGPVRAQILFFVARRARRPGVSEPVEQRHIPVLGREAVSMLAPRAGGIYVDATFGAGGYSRMNLETAGTRVIGIDRDRTAIADGFDLVERADGRLTLIEERFSHLGEVCAAQGLAAVDGVMMDLAFSSMQLDQPSGASPLHGRAARHADEPRGRDRRRLRQPSDEANLARIRYTTAKSRGARRVARAIVAAPTERPSPAPGSWPSVVERRRPAAARCTRRRGRSRRSASP